MGEKVKIETYREVIIKNEPDYYIIECRHCRGTGQKYPGKGGSSSDRKYECPTCDGTGFNKVSSKDNRNIYKCNHCKGTGQKYPGKSGTSSDRKYTCPTCDGLGILQLKGPRIECQHCRGTGQKYPKKSDTNSDRKYTCSTCGGYGSNHIDSIT